VGTNSTGNHAAVYGVSWGNRLSVQKSVTVAVPSAPSRIGISPKACNSYLAKRTAGDEMNSRPLRSPPPRNLAPFPRRRRRFSPRRQAFVDFLAPPSSAFGGPSAQSHGSGSSPYSALSAFAGNPSSSRSKLPRREGWLTWEAGSRPPRRPTAQSISAPSGTQVRSSKKPPPTSSTAPATTRLRFQSSATTTSPGSRTTHVRRPAPPPRLRQLARVGRYAHAAPSLSRIMNEHGRELASSSRPVLLYEHGAPSAPTVSRQRQNPRRCRHLCLLDSRLWTTRLFDSTKTCAPPSPRAARLLLRTGQRWATPSTAGHNEERVSTVGRPHPPLAHPLRLIASITSAARGYWSIAAESRRVMQWSKPRHDLSSACATSSATSPSSEDLGLITKEVDELPSIRHARMRILNSASPTAAAHLSPHRFVPNTSPTPAPTTTTPPRLVGRRHRPASAKRPGLLQTSSTPAMSSGMIRAARSSRTCIIPLQTSSTRQRRPHEQPPPPRQLDLALRPQRSPPGLRHQARQADGDDRPRRLRSPLEAPSRPPHRDASKRAELAPPLTSTAPCHPSPQPDHRPS